MFKLSNGLDISNLQLEDKNPKFLSDVEIGKWLRLIQFTHRLKNPTFAN